ncbi:MAG: hypothetical protein JW885_14285 [Deltaproteobacteria bacterium]|mgnify:CR=1 FL=1|nr:hypothetical protein [Candidatus Zymogenaceae bacterium]
MTDAHIFQLFGLVYTAAGLGGLLTKTGYLQNLLEDFSKSPALLYLSGMMAVVVGFLLVTFHNDWVLDWTVIITVFGWIALIKGLLLMALQGMYAKIFESMRKRTTFLKGYSVLVLILGIFFLVLGFWVV